MSNDKELDDILASLKDDKARLDQLLNESVQAKVEPPVQKKEERSPAPQFEITIESKNEILEPPKLSSNEQKKEVKKSKPKKEKKQKKKVKKIQFDSTIKQRIKALIDQKVKKTLSRQAIIITIAIVLIIAIIIGSFSIYNYSRTAYLKPYEKQYSIEYPEGILEQFCDQYGKNQDTVGAIAISDTDTNKYILKHTNFALPYLEYGSTIDDEQQFNAIHLSSTYADLESVYSTADGFLASSQKVVFNTLYERNTYQVVCVYYVNTIASDDSGYRFPYALYGNMTEDSFEEFVDRMKNRRLYDTGYEYSYDDTFLTLSVDSDFMDNFRFVVLCKKVDKDVTKSTTATPNDNIRYPQVWYDKNDKVNPFRFASQWYPEIYTDANRKYTATLTETNFK